jgi:hypothetical protein
MRLRRQIWLLRRQIFGSGGSVGNNFAPTANLASRQLSRQIFGSVGKCWLRRQIIGSVGQFGFCGSSVGNHVASVANLASRQLSRQIVGSVGKYLAIWLRRQLRRQIIDSAGKLGFCGSSVGKWRTHARTNNNNKQQQTGRRWAKD